MWGSNSLFNYDDWNPLFTTLRSTILKWDASSSSSELDSSESSSFSFCNWVLDMVNDLVIFFTSFASFFVIALLVLFFVLLSSSSFSFLHWYNGTLGITVFTLISLLFPPILFIGYFIIYISFIISASSAFSFTSIFLLKQQSSGCRHFGHGYFTVFVQEMNRLWTGLGLQVFPGDEVILKVHLQLSVLWATLPQ